jgi:cation:H+ antiporter
MNMLRFDLLAPGWNAVLFAMAGAVVWYAGIRLARYAKLISDRLKGQQALIGTLLLGGVASLPETATSVSASLIGNAPLAINMLLGGIAVTMAIIAIVDAIKGWEPLSVDVVHPIILLQGALVVLFLTVAAAGMIAGDRPVLNTGIGGWTSALLLLYLFFIWLIKHYERSTPWIPRQASRSPPAALEPAAIERKESKQPVRASLGALILRILVASTAILMAGYILARTSDALAEQTGLGASFVGMVLGGISTSLPELSTTLAAVRLKQYEMAFADAFGTNLFSVMLLFFADAAYSKQPILNEAGRFSIFAILLGIAVTTVYLAGLIMRRNYIVLKMGIDSLIVLLLYLGGLIVLFHLR